jgi:hypothetical protein
LKQQALEKIEESSKMTQRIVKLEAELQAANKRLRMHETNPDVDREFEAVYEQARLS